MAERFGMDRKAKEYFGIDEGADDASSRNTEYIKTTGDATPDAKNSKLGRKVLKTVGWSTALLTIGAGGFFVADVLNNNKPLVYDEVEITKAPELTVKTVTMEIKPITLTTSEITVPRNEATWTTNILGIDTPAGRVVRDVNTELFVDFDPGLIEVTYDASTEQLTYIAPNASLTARVEIPNGGATTIETPDNVLTIGAQVLAGASDMIVGTLKDLDMDPVRVPILADVADGRTDIQTGLEKYIDFSALKAVNDSCMSKITKIPGFQKQIENLMAETARDRLLDENVDSDELLKLPNVKQIVADATVEMKDDKFEIGPDQKIIDQAKAYEEAGVFKLTDNSKPVVCDVDKNLKLTVVDNGTSN